MAAVEYLVAAACLPALERTELALAVKWPQIEALALDEALTLFALVRAVEWYATVRPSKSSVAVEVLVASPVD